MKSKSFQYFLKFYITLFSILVLVSIALSVSHLMNREFDQMLSVMKNCSTFIIALLFGLYYEKIEHWLGLHWNKKKS
jgi:carbon starvation protein CstA